MSADPMPPNYGMLVILLIAVLPFLGGFSYPFVFDDTGVIIENTFLKDSSNVRDVLRLSTIRSPDVIDGQRPLVILSYFADRWAWGEWPSGYRITNYLIHAGNAGLLFMLLMRLGGPNLLIAGAATLVFAWHPLGIEVVHSPAFREDSLCLLGGLIFLLAGTSAPPAWPGMMVGVAGFASALLAKESGAMFLMVTGVVWALFPAFRPGRSKLLMLSGAAFAALMAYGVLLAERGAAQAIGERWNGLSLNGIECILSPPWLFVRSLAKIIVPWPLSVDYRVVPVTSLLDFRFWTGIGSGLLLLYAAWRQRKTRPAVSIGILWMMGAFVPVSNLWPLFNPVADRYAYLMLPGFALVIAGLHPLINRRIAWTVIAGGLLLAGLTVRRIPDWRDERTLWTAALVVEPRSARAQSWLGIIENAGGRPDVAFAHFDAARNLNPQDPGPLVNMGVVMLGQGDAAAAEFYFREALRLHPGQVQARDNLVGMGLTP